jgi:hypothetical protein
VSPAIAVEPLVTGLIALGIFVGFTIVLVVILLRRLWSFPRWVR